MSNYFETWVPRFFLLASTYASFSKDPSSKIGCVAVDPHRKHQISYGWNGFPRKFNDSHERLTNRTEKYKFVIHAEANALVNASRNGSSLEGSDLFVHGLPICSQCALLASQSGIKRVFQCIDSTNCDEKWVESNRLSSIIFNETDVELFTYDITTLAPVPTF